MSETGPAPLPILFRKWRHGDAESGQEMAQRFSDWYYAITVSRLGEMAAREPLQRVCETFARNITTVPSSSHLLDWAHGLVQAELAGTARSPGSDIATPATGNRSPSTVLQGAWAVLPERDLVLLSHAYNPTHSHDDLVTEAEQAGGYPMAILLARQSLKSWLAQNAEVHFQILPSELDRDLAPLPLYEAGRLASPTEELRFEQWMASRVELCRDVAEFSPFAMAIRAGAFANRPRSQAPAPTVTPAVLVPPQPGPKTERMEPVDGAPPTTPRRPPALIIVGIVVVLLLVGLIVLLLR